MPISYKKNNFVIENSSNVKSYSISAINCFLNKIKPKLIESAFDLSKFTCEIGLKNTKGRLKTSQNKNLICYEGTGFDYESDYSDHHMVYPSTAAKYIARKISGFFQDLMEEYKFEKDTFYLKIPLKKDFEKIIHADHYPFEEVEKAINKNIEEIGFMIIQYGSFYYDRDYLEICLKDESLKYLSNINSEEKKNIYRKLLKLKKYDYFNKLYSMEENKKAIVISIIDMILKLKKEYFAKGISEYLKLDLFNDLKKSYFKNILKESSEEYKENFKELEKIINMKNF